MFKEFQLSFADIASLTDEQIADVLLCERDEHGNKVRRAVAEGMDFREVVYRVWRLREPNISEQELAARFKKEYPGYGG